MGKLIVQKMNLFPAVFDKVTFCFPNGLRIACFGLSEDATEKNEAEQGFLACNEWNSEIFTFEIDGKKAFIDRK